MRLKPFDKNKGTGWYIKVQPSQKVQRTEFFSNTGRVREPKSKEQEIVNRVYGSVNPSGL